MYPWKVAIGCKCFWKFPQLNVYGLIMFKTFAPEHSWRLTFQFPGISVPVPAIYHVKGINKEENGSTFALAKAFSFGWRKRCSMNNIKKTILVLLKQKKILVKSHLATPALPVLELWIGTRYTMKTCCDPAHRHTRSATLRAPSPAPRPWHKILSWGAYHHMSQHVRQTQSKLILCVPIFSSWDRKSQNKLSGQRDYINLYGFTAHKACVGYVYSGLTCGCSSELMWGFLACTHSLGTLIQFYGFTLPISIFQWLPVRLMYNFESTSPVEV